MVPPPCGDKAVHAHGFGPVRLVSVNRFMISDSDTAETTAPPKPCTVRAYYQQQNLRIGHTACKRRQREQRNAAEEQLAVAVKDPPSRPPRSRQPPKGKDVGINHPHQQGFSKAEGPRAIDGNAIVHDRRIEHDHEHAEAGSTMRASQRLRSSMRCVMERPRTLGAGVARDRMRRRFSRSPSLSAAAAGVHRIVGEVEISADAGIAVPRMKRASSHCFELDRRIGTRSNTTSSPLVTGSGARRLPSITAIQAT